MKVTVISEFIDIHSNELHNVGDVLEITDERYKEIMQVGKFVQQVEEPPAEQTEQPKTGSRSRKKTAKDGE